MKSHPVSPATPRHLRTARRSVPARLAAFALAVIFTSSQLPAQNPMNPSIVGQNQATNRQAQAADSQAAKAEATSADQGSPAAPAAEAAVTDLSEPVPNLEEATVEKPYSDSLFSLAPLGEGQDNGQSSSAQDNGQNSSSTTAQNPKPAKTKPPHHGLGVALVITGSALLAVGVASAVVGNRCFCTSSQQSELRDLGYTGIGVGAPVAVLGFYYQFHK